MEMINSASIIINDSETGREDLDAMLESVACGDKSAFEALYRSMKSPIYGYALSILKNVQDAQDVTHDCFVNIYKAAPFYRNNGKAKSWIMTIARNLCIQKLRENKKISAQPQEDWEIYLDTPQGLSTEDKLVIEHCMKLLSDEERQIIVLHAVSGFKHREISALLDLPISTVLSKYNRAIKKMREVINGGKTI